MTAETAAASVKLPSLRDDLQLVDGEPSASGAPTWLIYDAIGHRYIRLDLATHELLSLWPAHTTVESLAAGASQTLGRAVGAAEIQNFIGFLHQHNLTREPARGGWKHYAQQSGSRKRGWAHWLLHNYLFLAVPLVRPERFLRATMPIVAPLFTPVAVTTLVAVGLTALYLVSRQWDAFTATFQHFDGLEGALAFGAVMLATKTIHELGHAYAATKFGCRVPTLGIAFMLLAPMPYADVTDAWKLKNRHERLLIDGAGILAELALAVIATFLWVFLPDGTLRTTAFVVACVGWVISLGINLNPFARFDGYYLMSDLLGIDNLQARSFGLAQWRLREILFELGGECPERLPARTTAFLIGFAWATWIYRLLLFIGIAAVVYYATFKLLGILLFIVEIAVFVAGPILREIAVWWSLRTSILAGRRWRLTAAALGGMSLLAIVPWSTRVELPAIVESAELHRIFPPRAADVVAVHVTHGQMVEAGARLVTLGSPQIDHDLRAAETSIRLLRVRLARRAADTLDRAETLVLERELALLVSKRDGLLKERDELVIKAPGAGRIAEFNPAIHPGRAVSRSEQIATLVGGSTRIARGYVREIDAERIRAGATGRFISPQAPLDAVAVEVAEIASASAVSIDIPELAARYAGEIIVQAKDRRTLKPVATWYPVTMTLADPAAINANRHRGSVVLDGKSESLLLRGFNHVAKILIRESGF